MRIIKNGNGNGFELVYLGQEERKKLRHRLRVENRVIMRQCIKDAEKLIKPNVAAPQIQDIAFIAGALFDKLALRMYTLLCEAETLRVYNEKEAAKAVVPDPPRYRTVDG